MYTPSGAVLSALPWAMFFLQVVGTIDTVRGNSQNGFENVLHIVSVLKVKMKYILLYYTITKPTSANVNL